MQRWKALFCLYIVHTVAILPFHVYRLLRHKTLFKPFSSFSIAHVMAGNLLRSLSLLISFATKVNVFGKGGILFLAVLLTLVYTSWHTEAVILPFRSSFQAELLACPRVPFSSKSLSLSLITSFCKNSLSFHRLF